MPSNCNESIRSCALYKPPHLRKGLVDAVCSLNNNTSNCLDNNSKINNNDVPKFVHKESLAKLYIPPAKRNLKNAGQSGYFDVKFKGSRTEYSKKLKESTTVYVGNLNLITTEADVHNLFSKAGKIKTIIMGLNKITLNPGGFCFVDYETRSETENCMKLMNESLLDGKKLFVDWDAGFIEGRQYCRVKRNHQKSFTIYPSTQK